uniref:Uncharacterized protein n=1 Tax=Candidatus Kentrum sp. TC TaxID=2126339 RepID=A0A450Z303_9GAMM|nr:MAG: hypothetical protein BECKTC1821E_GA0114239_11048 [Candidatus Kentron sp. TC]
MQSPLAPVIINQLKTMNKAKRKLFQIINEQVNQAA